MNQIVTEGIVLSRIDYGEADRIITLLTPDQGKLRLMAKGVRRIKSKLAGGIELFSISSITFVKGRGEIGTLVSTRLAKHYGRIVADLDRTMVGYDLIKQLNKVTEDEPEPEYFELLKQVFEALDDPKVSLPLVRFWFAARLLNLGGHTPNLQTDTEGRGLEAGQTYDFNAEAMCFRQRPGGKFDTNAIKFLRLSFSKSNLRALASVQGADELAALCEPTLTNALRNHLL